MNDIKQTATSGHADIKTSDEVVNEFSNEPTPSAKNDAQRIAKRIAGGDELAPLSAISVPQAGQESATADAPADTQQPKEYGGPKGLEPTRYGDWERNGRCYDF